MTSTEAKLTVAMVKLVKQIPISCVDLNSVTIGRYRVDCGLYEIVLGS
jgi:hypothetical protein